MNKRNLLLFLLVIPIFISAQNSSWSANYKQNRSFIENKGQYDGMNWKKNSQILFGTKQGGWFTFFTKEGITHRLEKLIKNPKKKPGMHGIPSRLHKSQIVQVNWLNTNSNTAVSGNQKSSDYHSYAVRDKFNPDIVRNIKNVDGYKEVVYKNIYNNIDVVYTFHEDGGIKYDIILHPGANPSDIKLQYKTAQTNLGGEYSSVQLNSSGEIEIKTSLGTITEKVPFTFYNDSKQEIKSKYKFQNNILSFELENYDASRRVVIDPWIVTPVWDDGDFTREVETDAAGNVYTIGGETPMQLRKYNGATGALIWTYNTPWDTIGGDWLGTLATDANGNSFITQGTDPQIERVDNAGNMIWHNNNSGWSVEYWSITFNCDNTKLIVGGTKSTAPLFFPIDFYAMMYDIDPANGNVLAEAYLDTSSFGVGSFLTPVEVRSITSTKNSRYIFLTHNDVGAQDENFNACTSGGDPTFQVDNTEHLGYKCENYLSAQQNGGGLKALASGDDYFYTHKGDEILQWDVNTGALINSVNLPGGSANSSAFGLVVHCSGLDVDANGNVYAGSMDRVVKFDANLNILSQAMTTGGFTVYDVDVNSNGEVIAGGAILNNSTATGRGGRLESLNMTAGAQYALTCCDPNFCPVDTLCTTDGSVTLAPNVGGGAWSVSPATGGFNSSTGVFDPSAAGPGTYLVSYTLGCGFTSNQIVVINCSTTCDATITPAGPFCENGSPTNLTGAQPGGTWTGTGITNGTNGTFDPSVAGVGNHIITYTLPTCNDTVVIVVNPLPVAGTNGTATLCSGASSINLIDSLGGTPDAGGSWSGPSGLTGGDQGTFDPATNTAGTYTYTVTNSCGSVNSTVTVTLNPSPNTGTDGTATLCSGSSTVNLLDSLGGTPDAGGSWSGPSGLTGGDQGTFDPATNTAGTYTYTVTNSCGTSNNNVVVTINPAPDAGTFGNLTICPTDPATDLFNQLGGTPDNGGTWSGPSALANGDQGTFDPATNSAGMYIYTVTNSCGTDTASVNVTISPNPVPGTNGTATFCSGASTANLLDSLGGTPSSGGSWSGPSGLTGGDLGTFDPTTNAAGTYTYTVNDCSGSPQTADVVVTINPAPDAGTFGNLTICPNDPATDLFNQLGGTPDNGGTWSGPSALANGDQGTFDPATNSAGTYIYTVTNSCGTDTASINVTISSNPVPGTNGTATFCSGASTANLLDSLGGTPSSGGSWSGPSGLTGGDQGTFDPATNAAGTYTYTVNDCSGSPQTADVVVTINPAPDAGTFGNLTICPNDPATDLFNQLGGTPDNGGTWSGPSALANGDQGTFDPATNSAGTYIYTVTNSCGTDTASVNVTISSNPVPGSNGTATICSNASSINLIDSLGGTPSSGGSWSGPSGLTGGDLGTFDPATNAAGTYTYTVNDCSGNPQTADVVVTIIPGPDAGTDGSITLCTTDPATDLFNQLGGTPDLGGTWSPAMNSGTGVFDPSVDAGGTYTYTVINSCGSISANVVVTVSACTVPTAGYTVSDSTICAGECVTFTDASSGATTWEWTFSGGSPSSATGAGPHSVCYGTDGTFNVELIVTNSNGADTITSTIEVYPAPVIDAGSDVTIDLGDSTQLVATGSTGTYSWTPPTWLDCALCPDPVATPTETVTYTVVVVDSNGCTASDDVTVIVDFDYIIWVPNIFSPNGDGANDVVYVRGAGVANLKFFIYDRWGEKVFETTDMNTGWDGTFRGQKMNNAVFVYYLEATFLDGTETTKKGDITLIR